METPAGEQFCMVCGWSGDRAPIGCPSCGSPDLAAVRAGALVAIPAGHWVCGGCGAPNRPVTFRGTSRVGSIIWFLHVRRVSGYWCERCALRKTAMSLTYTGLLGWWGVFGLFFWAPRATYQNWRAVWAPPRKPLDWGALPVDVVAATLAEAREARGDNRWSAFDVDEAAERAT